MPDDFWAQLLSCPLGLLFFKVKVIIIVELRILLKNIVQFK
jgi:hypothetical protein